MEVHPASRVIDDKSSSEKLITKRIERRSRLDGNKSARGSYAVLVILRIEKTDHAKLIEKAVADRRAARRPVSGAILLLSYPKLVEIPCNGGTSQVKG